MTADSNDPKVHDDSETQALLDHIAYEVVLITRYAAQNLPTIKRKSIMDRSALILLARLKAQGPMTVNERSEEHTSELQSRGQLVCRLLLEKKKKHTNGQKDVITEPDN